MQIPLLPTDNLYKFITVFGIALYISLTVYKEREKDALSLKTIELESKISAVDEEVDVQVQRKAAHLYKNYLLILETENKKKEYSLEDFFQCMNEALHNDSIDNCWLEDSIFSNYEQTFKYDSLGAYFYFESRKKLAEIKREIKYLSVEESITKKNIRMLTIGQIGGAFLFLIGSGLWFFRLQRHVDDKLAIQSGKRMDWFMKKVSEKIKDQLKKELENQETEK